MQWNRVYAIYFSPTGTSKKGVLAVTSQFDRNAQELDLTVCNQLPETIDFESNDLVVFGAPVYSGHVYHSIRQRFSRLHGKNTPCIITVTYGNRHYDDALIEMTDLAVDLGFLPFAAAALIGQHTFGHVQIGRPNEQDLEEDREFARQAAAKLQSAIPAQVEVKGKRPYKTLEPGKGRGSFRPRTNDQCIQCGLCARNCPEQAICYDDFCTIDDTLCISCFRCIQHCPVHAKNMNTPQYTAFSTAITALLALRRENEYFL